MDDITFSGENASKKILHEIRSTIFRAGLRAHKDHYYPANSYKSVTGVIVNGKGIRLPFSRKAKINSLIHSLDLCSNVNEKLSIYQKLVSTLYEASQIEVKYKKIAQNYQQEWKILKKSL